MRRVERKLLRINDELLQLNREEELLRGELDMHRSLHDDASRDAAVHDSPVERANAYESGKDVTAFERALAALEARRRILRAKRERLLERLEA